MPPYTPALAVPTGEVVIRWLLLRSILLATLRAPTLLTPDAPPPGAKSSVSLETVRLPVVRMCVVLNDPPPLIVNAPVPSTLEEEASRAWVLVASVPPPAASVIGRPLSAKSVRYLSVPPSKVIGATAAPGLASLTI